MKIFFHRTINILILAVFVFGQLQPVAALQAKKRAVDTGRPSSSFSKAAGRHAAKALRQGLDTVSPVDLPAQGGAPVEKFPNLPSNTPAVDKQPAFIDTAGAARLSLRLSANPKFIAGNGTVTIRWKISGALRQFQALSLQVRLPEGYEPGAGLQSAYDAATRVLTFPVSTAGGQFVLNANNPAGDAVFSAALFSGSQALAETSLVLPKHETFSAGKGSSPSTGFRQAQPTSSRYYVFSARQGKIRVEIPGAALPEDAIINIGSPVEEAMPEYSLSGSPFEIDAVGKRSKKDLHRFSDDITIQVSYADLNIPAEQLPDLLVYWYNPDTKEWEALPSHVDPQTKTISALTNHFSVFDIGINNWQASHLPTVDAFQVSSFTGAGTYSLPIEVPPGPGGFQPKLALSYNSQVVDQSTTQAQASWVGMGWSLEAGSIERNTQGGTFILNVAGISALIVKDASGVYHAADENFMKFSFDSTANKWTVWDKSGNVYFFERAARTRYNTTAPDGSHCGSTWLTYKWSLTRIRNAFGQELAYSYTDETKTMKFDVYSSSKQKCVTGDVQTVVTATFPVSITYPGGRTRLRFEREVRADYPSGWATDGAFHVFGRTRLKSLYVEQDANGDGTFETLIRRYDLLYAADDAADVIWPGVAWSAGDKTATLKEVRQYGLGGTQSLPATTFTYGDSMHLTRADNGYGGAVEFDYDRWVYEPNGRPSHRVRVSFGAAGQSCTTGNFTARSGYVTCFKNGGVPDQLGVRGVAINTIMVSSFFYGRNMVRPSGTYLIKASGGPDPHVTVNFGLFDGSTDTFVPFTGGSSVVDLPVTASRADVLVQAVQNGGTTTEFGRFFNISIQLLPSFYRVTQKRLYDGQGNVYPFSYGYQGPAVNDSATSPGSCTDAQLFANPPTCKQYIEKYSEFRGHSQVTETGPDGRQAVTTFYQDDVLKGRPSSVTVRDANGNVLTQQSTTYTSTTLSLSKFTVNYIGFTHSWIRTASEESRIYHADGTTYDATQTAYTYEATYGNLTGKVESSWNGSGWDLYRTTRIDTFPYNSASLYLTGLPARQQVLDANNNVLAEVLNIYDANSTYNTAPTVGRLSATRTWVQGSSYAQASFAYDGWGNRTSVTAYDIYGGVASTPPSGARALTTAFDSTYHTYPVSETDPLGHVTSWSYDTALGLLLSETDANGQTTSASYDAFGRLTTLVRPGDDSAHPTIRATYNDTLSPFRIDLQQRIDGDMYSVVRNTYDGLGRKFKTETGSSVDGTFSLYNTMLATFNAYGKPLSQSMPFGPGETPFYATMTHDALGRPLTVSTPDGANAVYSYDGLSASVTDSNGHTTATTLDVWGRTVSVTPPAGPAVTYQYDPLNRLVAATRGGLTTDITYDHAGRKAAMSDPDMGIWSYAYDALGALVSQTDARGCTLGLSYDALGRLTGKSSSGNCGTQVNTVYTYDGGANGIGRRTGMIDGSGSTAWSYDARGRVASESKTIDSQSFVTVFTYNSANLPVSMTYPDGEVVTNTYTPQMLLSGVTGTDPSTGSGTTYVSDTSYDSAGRIDLRTFGNGTQTDYSYYAWNQQGGRLSTLTTSRLADQATLQNLAYTYDAVGNIDTITDAVAGETQSFSYDALDRLVSTGATGGPAPYSESYSYDPLTGNLAAKAGVNYTYDGNHPHAVASLSNGNSYEYDANGNQTTRVVNGQTFQLSYDAEGRLVSVVNLNPQAPAPTETPTDTAMATDTATPTDTPTETATATPTDLPPATSTPSPLPSATFTPTDLPTFTPTAAVTDTETPIATATSTGAPTDTPTPLNPPIFGVQNGGMSEGQGGSTGFSLVSFKQGPVLRSVLPAPVNLALNKPASQSSTYSHSCNPVAAKAVDGNTDGNFFDCSQSHTNADAQAWWQVDLGQSYVLSSIEIWNRTDCCADRLSNFKVYVSGNAVNWTQVYYNPGQAPTQTVFSLSQTARYVKVQLLGTNYLTLAEIKVWGALATLTPTITPTPIAQVKPAADKLVSWWSLNETSGVRVDSHGANDLTTDHNGAGRSYAEVAPSPTPTATPAIVTPTPTPAPAAQGSLNATFTYDGDGRMVKAVLAPASGTGDPVTVLYVGGHYQIAGGVVTKYYFAGAQRVAMRTNGALYYLLADHLGSTSAVTGADGSLVSEQRYTAWGEVRYASGANPTDYTYTGQRSYTNDFGLMSYNARWYDPALGRFAQADTIVPENQGVQGFDRYAYVNNAPLNYVDPSGHSLDADKLRKLLGFSYSAWSQWVKDPAHRTFWNELLGSDVGDIIVFQVEENGELYNRQFTIGEDEDGNYHFWDLGGTKDGQVWASQSSDQAQAEVRFHIDTDHPWAIYQHDSYNKLDRSITIHYKFNSSSSLFTKLSDEILITPLPLPPEPSSNSYSGLSVSPRHHPERMVLKGYIPWEQSGPAGGYTLGYGAACGMSAGLGCIPAVLGWLWSMHTLTEYKPVYYPPD